MRFELPQELLERLVERRRLQRLERRGRPRPAVESFLQHLSTAASADAAEEYVDAMWSWQEEIEDAHDAFLLDPGMGPMLYLTAKGHILVDGRGWDGEPLRQATGEEAIVAVLAGAKKTGIAELVSLLPPKPPTAVDCPTCRGTHHAPLRGSEGSAFATRLFVCWDCQGLGWKPSSAEP